MRTHCIGDSVDAPAPARRGRRGLTGAALLFLVVASAQAQPDPDALYRQRGTIARAQEAATIWEARQKANPGDFESAWKFARAAYWLGQHDAEGVRESWLERGAAAARVAAKLQPSRPEGHFWMSANLGMLAEVGGLRQGLRRRGEVKEALETVLRLDPKFMSGSADRALGRWYFKVPALLGGSKSKSEEHLRKSLTYDPDSTISHFFLAETLFELNRDAEAIQELQKVIAAPINPEYEPEDREYKRKAAELLAKRGGNKGR